MISDALRSSLKSILGLLRSSSSTTEDSLLQLCLFILEKMYRSPEVIILSSQDIIELSNWSEEDVDLLFWDSRFPAGELGENKIIEIHALISFFAKKEAVLSRQLAASDAGICKSHNCEMNGEEV